MACVERFATFENQDNRKIEKLIVPELKTSKYCRGCNHEKCGGRTEGDAYNEDNDGKCHR